MNKFLIGAGVVALVAVPALALQQGAMQPPPARGAPITRAEVQARIQQRFAAADANRDGAVTQAELDAGREKRMQERQAGRAERRGRAFAMLDADKNGQLSQQEFAAVRPDRGSGGAERPFARDGRGGGRHDRMGRGMGAGGRWIERADANKDGKLTLAEASAKPLAMFDGADANKDGTVTPEERRAARAGWFSRRG